MKSQPSQKGRAVEKHCLSCRRVTWGPWTGFAILKTFCLWNVVNIATTTNQVAPVMWFVNLSPSPSVSSPPPLLQPLSGPAGRQPQQRGLLHRLAGQDGGRVALLVQQLALRLPAGLVPKVTPEAGDSGSGSSSRHFKGGGGGEEGPEPEDCRQTPPTPCSLHGCDWRIRTEGLDAVDVSIGCSGASPGQLRLVQASPG